MWCANCQADVAAEVSVDHQRVRCASCGSDLGESNASRLSATTRSAREILERWSQGGSDDPFGPPEEAVPSAPSTTDQNSPAPKIDTIPIAEFASKAHDPSSPAKQLDEIVNREFAQPPLSLHEPPKPSVSEAQVGIFPPSDVTASADPSRSTTQNLRQPSNAAPNYRFDSATTPNINDAPSLPPTQQYEHTHPPHEASGHVRADAPGNIPRSPHFEVQHAINHSDKKSDWGSVAGQWLAYLGVLGLTLGTCIVVYGHFGEQPVYTPTGWLVMTFGQMLLFLGIISLVSGGMEQTSNEVAKQVEALSDQLRRLENTARFHNGQEVNFRGDEPHRQPSVPHFSPVESPAPRERHVVEQDQRR